MFKILKNIIWTLSYQYVLESPEEELLFEDGMNGLKNAFITKTNPFFHLYTCTFKFREKQNSESKMEENQLEIRSS